MTKYLPISLLLTTAALALAAPTANAAIFIKYDGIKGSVTAKTDSPISVALSERKHLSALELTIPTSSLFKAGDDKRQDYLTITLKEVMVSGFQTSDDNTIFSLNYSEIKYPPTSPALNHPGGANFALSDGSVKFVK